MGWHTLRSHTCTHAGCTIPGMTYCSLAIAGKQRESQGEGNNTKWWLYVQKVCVCVCTLREKKSEGKSQAGRNSMRARARGWGGECLVSLNITIGRVRVGECSVRGRRMKPGGLSRCAFIRTWAAELLALDLSDSFIGQPPRAGAAGAARLDGIVLQVVGQPLQVAVTDEWVLS